MARRQKIDTASAAVRIMAGARREMVPPSHVPLDDQDWPFWESVVAEFARAEWSEHQLELAAMLARTMSNLEAEQRTLRAEGYTVFSAKGLPVLNPRAQACRGMSGDILAMRRSLALHARARNGGDNRNAGTAREHGKRVQAEVADDLLAAPEAL